MQQRQLQKLGLQLQLYNAGQGRLNHECGAVHVQKEQSFPAGEAVTVLCCWLFWQLCKLCAHIWPDVAKAEAGAAAAAVYCRAGQA
jgi:hypothetical protein